MVKVLVLKSFLNQNTGKPSAQSMNDSELQLDLEELAAIHNSLSNYNRLYTYLRLYDRYSPMQICNELDVTRNALQHYINDWKELNLIYSEGNDYIFTDKGEAVAQDLQNKTTAVSKDTAEKIGEKHYSKNQDSVPDYIQQEKETPNENLIGKKVKAQIKETTVDQPQWAWGKLQTLQDEPQTVYITNEHSQKFPELVSKTPEELGINQLPSLSTEGEVEIKITEDRDGFLIGELVLVQKLEKTGQQL